METLLQDLRYALRMLVKSPGFAVVAVLSLALGIGANTTIFTLINAVFLHPLPLRDPQRIVSVFGTDRRNNGDLFNYLEVSYPNFEDFRDKNTVFTGLYAEAGAGLSLSTGAEPKLVNGDVVSGNYFDVLGVRPAAGRFFLPEEDGAPGAHPVVVLSYPEWRRQFGGDPGVVGRVITLNAQSFTVVGIAPEGFRGANAIGGPDLWVPMAMHDQVFTGVFKDWFHERRALLFNVVGRLKPGVTLDQASANMKTLATQLAQEYPKENGERNVSLVSLAGSLINPNVRSQFVLAGGLLMGAVLVVLLIACTNVANLLLARAARRQREMAIRLSLGAGRRRLVRQLLTESLLLAAVAGILGVLFAFWARDLLWSLRPPFFPADGLDMRLDGRVLIFTALAAVLTGILFGLLPALAASRPSLMGSLKDRSGAPLGTNRWYSARNLLVSAQVALSLVSLVGAGLFLRSLHQAQMIDPGFDTKHLMLVSFDLGAQGYPPAKIEQFQRDVSERLKSLPMVRGAVVAANAPFAGGFLRTVFPEGVDTSDRRSGTLMITDPVQPGFFSASGTPLLRGRDFNETDRTGAPYVAVVNEAMAKHVWPNQDPIGKRFQFFGETYQVDVIGLARNSDQIFLGEPSRPVVYLPLLQHPTPAATLWVRTDGDPSAAVGTIRSTVQNLDRNLPLTGVQTMEEVMAASLWAPRMGAGLLGAFGLLALLLAAIGVYGVMSYSVTQRVQEIGIRITLGAQRRDVLRMILQQGMMLVVTGVAFGLVAAFVLMRGMGALLYGIGSADPLTLFGASALLAGIALAACWLPASRATRVDPLVALRYE